MGLVTAILFIWILIRLDAPWWTYILIAMALFWRGIMEDEG